MIDFSLSELNLLDFILLGLCLYMVLYGAIRGFWLEVISLCCWVSVLYALSHFVDPVEDWYFAMIGEEFLSFVLSMATNSIGIILIYYFIRNLVLGLDQNKIGASNISSRLIGSALSLLKLMVMISLLVVFSNEYGFGDAMLIENSIVLVILEPITDIISSIFIPEATEALLE